MRYTTQNYFDEGGNRLVIGGEIVINGKLSIADDADVDELVTIQRQLRETGNWRHKSAPPRAKKIPLRLKLVQTARLMFLHIPIMSCLPQPTGGSRYNRRRQNTRNRHGRG